MLVYRVENLNASGMFTNGAVYRFNDKHGSRYCNKTDAYVSGEPDPGDGPSVRDDCIGFRSDVHVCGLISLKQLQRHWLRSPKVRRSLAARGQKVALYEVPEEFVIKGEAQVAFDRRHAKRIGYVPMPVKDLAA